MLGARIFGEIPRPVSIRSQKVIDVYKTQPHAQNKVKYYPSLDQHNRTLRKLRSMGIYHDEHMDFVEELCAPGITKRKATIKGQGKRALKRAKEAKLAAKKATKLAEKVDK